MPLTCLSNFGRTPEMPLINCEINLILTWSANCVISEVNRAITFTITDTYQLQIIQNYCNNQNHDSDAQLTGININQNINRKTKWMFRLLNWSSFQGLNRLLVLPFQDNARRTRQTGYFPPKVEIKGYNVMIDEQNVFDQTLKTDLRTYDSIRKIKIGPVDDYATPCLLNYSYFKENYKLISIDLSKQQALDADPKKKNATN